MGNAASVAMGMLSKNIVTRHFEKHKTIYKLSTKIRSPYIFLRGSKARVLTKRE